MSSNIEEANKIFDYERRKSALNDLSTKELIGIAFECDRTTELEIKDFLIELILQYNLDLELK